jgi:tetratricopeptide (TPR) repeat protein
MRGTTNRQLFEEFAAVVKDLNPSARDHKLAKTGFHDSYRALHNLSQHVDAFPRIFGYKAYALALSVHENWDLPNAVPEKTMTPQERLDEALRLADEAKQRDPTDHDLHWALADVRLARGAGAADTTEIDEAISSFEEAIFLNADERHPSLFAEAAAAYMYRGDRANGDHLKAEEYFKKAKRSPDWHHWYHGLFLFIKARQAGAGEEEAALDIAISELKNTHAQLEDDNYQHEIQLALALAYQRKSEIIDSRAKSTADPTTKKQLEEITVRHKSRANRALARFRMDLNHMRRDDVRRALPFRGDDKTYFEAVLTNLWP